MPGNAIVTPPTPHITKPEYAISNSDGVSARITHVMLKGSNYAEWSKGFRNGLGAKRKLGFVDGSLKRPAAGSEDLDDWITANCTVIAWIFNTIDPAIRSSISYRDTSVELWDDIRNRFSRGNDIQIYHLESEISDCKQKDGETIMDFYCRLKKLWDDVIDYDALPTCECSGCKCNISVKLRDRRETRQTRQFLMGLLPVYATARSSVLGITPLPSLDSVYSRMVQEEEVRTVTQDRSTAMAFAVHGGQGSGSKQGRPRLKCSHCKKPGHSEPHCWDKHGYPEGRGPRVSTDSDGGSSSSTAKVNSVHGEPSVDANHIRLNGKHPVLWIVDTGASTHVSGDIGLFEHAAAIRPLEVGLPNGSRLKATHKERVRINNDLLLHDVLYVPDFQCHLLSVSQLLSTQNFSIEFTNRNCVIQDPTLRTMIGEGDLVDGLYLLSMAPSTRVNVVKDNGDFELWHKRLGHPSSQAMELLPQVSSCKRNFDSQTCDICFRAKQTRSVFPFKQ
ncbi:hypothetical protein vseg_000892 [Gypsophila vaccaria]